MSKPLNLRDELQLLAAAVAKDLRERILKGDASPALLDVARKFLEDHREQVDPDGLDSIPKQPALNLPFVDGDQQDT